MTNESSDDILLVLSTVASEHDAERLARILVEERIAACVNVVPGLTSIYWWKGSVEREPEVLLLIKTTANAFARLKVRIAEVHPYEVPELLAFRAAEVSEGYGEWLRRMVSESSTSHPRELH